MHLVSWNLNGLSDKHLDVRTEAAMMRILLGGPVADVLMGLRSVTAPPDVVCLQEVTARTLAAHVRPHLQAAGFTVFPDTPRPREHFEVIASRLPIRDAEVSPLPHTRYGRERVSVVMDRLAVHTAHLDSLRDGGRERTTQIADVLSRMSGPSVFVGDMNLRDAEVPALGDVVDAWEAVGRPKAHKATWGRRMRFDRAYVHGLSVVGFETFGAETVDPIGQPASDHLGISLTVASG